MRTSFLTITAATIAISSIWMPLSASGASKTFVVTTALGSKDVPGSLTWAIYQANYQGADINYINFDIPGAAGEIEIVLTETLYIARPMIINGTSQPGYAGQPRVRINCSGFDSGFNVVAITDGSIPPFSDGSPATGGGSTIQGFRITNYRSNAITLSRGADGIVIANNQIGFTPAAAGIFLKNATLFPGCRGIGIASNSNTIRDNTISGVDNAITLGDDIITPIGFTCTNNRFEGNFIGTDSTGMIKVGNSSDGIFLGAGAQQNLIGPGNVFSGMASSGIELLHSTATGNIIFGNIIGLNAAGTGVIGNGELGVLLANGAANNSIGGPYGGAYPGNVISGNALGGVAIGTNEYPGATGTNNNHVEGNLIGTNGAGTAGLGTQISGITVQSGAKGNILRKNVIVGQVNHGVVLADASNNALYGNWIGETSQGLMIANGGFAVYLFNATNNIVQLPAANAGLGAEQNIFGLNALGSAGIYGASVGNIIDLTPTPTPTPGQSASRLLNISTRMRVEAGDNALIAGFIITGPSPKKVIIRGLGPSLSNFFSGALADPALELHQGSTTLATNDNWKTKPDGASQDAEIMATTIAPTNDLESAIVATLNPGAYTAILAGKNGGTGIGVVEVYDLDSTAPVILANISTRGIIQTGDNVMIAGLIIGAGQADSHVVFRGLGPSLSAAGVSNALNDPTLKIVNGNGVQVGQNDNWQDDAPQAAQLTALSISPSNTFESAMVANLSPGSYTAILSDKNGTAGTGLVEVYLIQ